MIQEIHSNAEQIDASKIPQFEIDNIARMFLSLMQEAENKPCKKCG
jgi:hypothetical protein